VFDPYRIRADFPILGRYAGDRPLVYLDNAATMQKPQAVIERIRHFYSAENANINRGLYRLSEEAGTRYEAARHKVARFLGAPSESEIVFTRGTTEAINLVAYSYGRHHVGPGDEILVSHMEHHANFVPWQRLCQESGARLRIMPITDNGALVLDALPGLLSEKTKLVALVHLSNALGTINPVKEVVSMAHAAGAPVLIDGAQSAAHLPLNVSELACDFFACSGHKLYGPAGIGVLYGRAARLEAMPPFHGGGDMAHAVTLEKTQCAPLPRKFEAGTPNIAGALGLAAAIDYVSALGLGHIAAHEQRLLAYGADRLTQVPGLRLSGTAEQKAAILAFTMTGIHPHDIAQILDGEGIAIRAGHHCAQPLMQRLGVSATARASLALYTTEEEIDTLARALHKVNEVFG